MNMFCWCLFGNIINVAAQRKEKKQFKFSFQDDGHVLLFSR